MKLAVLTYAHAYNPLGFPAEYPAQTAEVDDNAVIPAPWVEMTQEQLDERIALYQEQVQAIAAAEESLPTVVHLWQFRVALKQSGLYDQVKSTIAALPEQQRTVIEEKIEYGNTITRTHPSIKMLAQLMGMTQQQVNNLFRVAANLE